MRGWFLFPALLPLVAAAAMDEGTVTVRVQPDTVRVGERFVLSVEASGNSVGNPVISQVDGLTLSETPFSQGRGFKLMNNKMSSNITLKYSGVARKPGQIKIPPIGIRIDGKMVQSKPVTITVLEAGESAPPKEQTSPSGPLRNDPRGGVQSASTKAPSWNDLVFSELEADKTEVFVGEAVVLTYRLWAIELRGVRIRTPFGFRPTFPDTEGFIAIPENPEELGVDRTERGGWEYQINQWRQIIYPTAPGEFTIPSWEWECFADALTRDQGYQRKEYHLATDPVTIKVNPLPEHPDNFSGAVGEFKLDASLKRDEVMQGVSTELTVTIQGTGNPNAIGEAPIPDLKDVYLGDPEKESRVDPSTMTVRKTFTYAITPLKPGELIIPPIEFCYFDPDTARYETLRQGPFKLRVVAAVSERVFDDRGLDLGGQKVRVLAEDIMPAIRNPGPLRQDSNGIALPVTLAAAPALAYAGLALYMARKRRFESDTGFARSYRAKKKALNRLEDLRGSGHAADTLYHALIGYVADKFDKPTAGMTSDDVKRLLESRGIETGLTERFTKVLRRCERSRYASATLSPDETTALAEGGRAALEQLDAALRNGRTS